MLSLCASRSVGVASRPTATAVAVLPRPVVLCRSTQPNVDTLPPPPPPPPPPPRPPTATPWYKPSRRDFIVAGLGSIIGGGAMYIYDTFLIDDLVDVLEEAEDDLDMAEEYVSRMANVPTMADLEKDDSAPPAAK